MTQKSWILVAALVFAHLFVAFCMPQLFFRTSPDFEWLLASGLGVCVAQVNLIAVWAALTPGRLILRLLWSTFLATLIWYALVLGNQLRSLTNSFAIYRREDALLLGLILLAGVILAQGPLWIASSLFRWRLLPPGHEHGATGGDRQFRISHLLTATAVVSVALGLGRLLLPEGEWETAPLDGELWVLLPIVAVVNLFVVLPCVWGAFARGRILIWLAVGWLVYAVAVSIVQVLVISLFLGGAPEDVWLIMIVFNLAQCLCVFGTLVCLRGIGFRLQRPGQPSPPLFPPANSEGVELV